MAAWHERRFQGDREPRPHAVPPASLVRYCYRRRVPRGEVAVRLEARMRYMTPRDSQRRDVAKRLSHNWTCSRRLSMVFPRTDPIMVQFDVETGRKFQACALVDEMTAKESSCVLPAGNYEAFATGETRGHRRQVRDIVGPVCWPVGVMPPDPRRPDARIISRFRISPYGGSVTASTMHTRLYHRGGRDG